MGIAFLGLQMLKYYSNKDQLYMKEAKLKQKLKKQQELFEINIEKSISNRQQKKENHSTATSNGDKKDKLTTMNEEIERIERIM